MHFSEFKDWFNSADAQLAGRPPDLKLWWELKARLEAVTPEVASSLASLPNSSPPAVPAAPPLPVTSSHAAQPIDTMVADFPLDAGPLDPEPGAFRAFSNEKDGGLSADVVDALREQQADLRPAQRRRA